MSLDVSGFKTDNVTDMSYMFGACFALTSLDLSSFKTDNVTNMSYMFSVSGLTSLDLSSFKTDNVRNMSSMFKSCSSLTNLDLSSFKTDNVADMNRMFYGCSSLTAIYAGNGWTTEKVTNGSSMFNGCTSLVGGKGTTFDSNHTDYTYARIDGGTDAPGYFSYKEELPTGVNGMTKDSRITMPSAIYDLSGRRLTAPKRGLNIIGERKVFFK